ncbi:hypothetical protein GCM10028808_51930 [Spirosoma migulaei]
MKSIFLFLLLPFWLYGQGLHNDDTKYQNLLQKRSGQAINKLPPRVDLSAYVPSVINQGENGTCVAVSVGYYMRTLLEAQKRGLTDKKAIDALRFSPSYLYNNVKDAGDTDCTGGLDIGDALEYIKQNGLPLLWEAPFPNCQQPTAMKVNPDSRILDYVKLFGLSDEQQAKTLATKKALSELSPVVVGMQTTPSMNNLSLRNTLGSRTKTFLPWVHSGNARANFTRWQPELSTSLSIGHAMCIVGYDDTMFGKGAFKLVNSWGSTWGDKGYFWITYADFNQYAKYGYQAYLQPAGDKSNIILSADLTISLATFVTGTEEAVERTKAGTELAAYSVIRPQRTGTPFIFSVAVSKQTYLYLITANATDSVTTRLFPEDGFSPLIGRDTRMDLPKDKLLRLEGSTGLEYWLFLFSETAINIDDYVKKINEQKGSFSSRVLAAFGSALTPYQQVNYKEKKMGFFLTNQNRGRIVPLLVGMNHIN